MAARRALKGPPSPERQVPTVLIDEDRPRAGLGVGKVAIFQTGDDRPRTLGNRNREALRPRLAGLDAGVLSFPRRLQHQVGDGEQLLSRGILERAVVDA